MPPTKEYSMCLREIAVVQNILHIEFDNEDNNEDVWEDFVSFYDRFESRICSAKIKVLDFDFSYPNSENVLAIMNFLQSCGIEYVVDFCWSSREY